MRLDVGFICKFMLTIAVTGTDNLMHVYKFINVDAQGHTSVCNVVVLVHLY
jgi:hypothetical protein